MSSTNAVSGDAPPGTGAPATDAPTTDAHWDPDVSYGEYLQLDALMSCQQRRSGEHDEMMFIIIHQASELWLKLCVFEIKAAIGFGGSGDFGPMLKILARVVRILSQLTQSWSILATLTPADYARFRGSLGQSSGFQSSQYRELEFLLGNRAAETIRVHARTPAVYQRLAALLREPSLYDVVLRRMHGMALPIAESVLSRDFSRPYEADETVRTCWRTVYQSPNQWWPFYELGEKLIDIEQQFQRWRFDHMKTVERIIGRKRGTGGTSGVDYLSRALGVRLFPELWDVRTEL